jgi:hypothetical protein
MNEVKPMMNWTYTSRSKRRTAYRILVVVISCKRNKFKGCEGDGRITLRWFSQKCTVKTK